MADYPEEQRAHHKLPYCQVDTKLNILTFTLHATNPKAESTKGRPWWDIHGDCASTPILTVLPAKMVVPQQNDLVTDKVGNQRKCLLSIFIFKSHLSVTFYNLTIKLDRYYQSHH